MLLKTVAAKIFEHLLTDPSHGYSQYSRYGQGGYCNIVVNGKAYRAREGDRDCSSAIINAFEVAGISCGGASYTGNMRSLMCGTGNFRWHSKSSGYIPKYGDVYLNEKHHTAMCLGANKMGHFRISENGTIDGQEGDQTGKESMVTPYYDYPWDGILECISTKTDGKDNSNPAPDKTIDQIADEVIAGDWGSGDYRRKALTDAGYDYDKVQDRVNEKLSGNYTPQKTIDQLADEVIAGYWGSGEARKNALINAGYDYDKVQDRVNEKLTKPVYYEIKPGDTLTWIALTFGTTIENLQALNNIDNPNLINAGDTIRVK